MNKMCLMGKIDDLLSKLELDNASQEARDAAEELRRSVMVFEAEHILENKPHNIDTVEKLKAKIEHWHEFQDVCNEFVNVYGDIYNIEFFEEKLIFFAKMYSSSARKEIYDSYKYEGEEELKKFIANYKEIYKKMVANGELDA